MNDNHLDREEAEVYKLVKEYLKKRPFFSVLDIIGFLNYKLRKNENINRDKIEKIFKIISILSLFIVSFFLK